MEHDWDRDFETAQALARLDGVEDTITKPDRGRELIEELERRGLTVVRVRDLPKRRKPPRKKRPRGHPWKKGTFGRDFDRYLDGGPKPSFGDD